MCRALPVEWPATITSTCRSLDTISSGERLFVGIDASVLIRTHLTFGSTPWERATFVTVVSVTSSSLHKAAGAQVPEEFGCQVFPSLCPWLTSFWRLNAPSAALNIGRGAQLGLLQAMAGARRGACRRNT